MISVQKAILKSDGIAWFMAAALIMTTAAAVAAVPPLPPEKRIVAQVTGYLAAPEPHPMQMPNAVACDAAGTICVADGAQDRIVRFTAEGKLQSAIHLVGSAELNDPTGLRFDARGGLWIADTGNHRILVMSPDGQLVQEIIPPATADGKPCNATDVALTADARRTYVVDMKNQRILIRDNTGGQWQSLGEGGQALGQFQWPFMACISNQGDLLVTEVIGARVQLLSRADKWAGTFGSFGVELGELYRPKGITVDSAGRIFVSDSTTNVVQVFSAGGASLGALTDTRGNLLRFAHPMGMCFDPRGRLLVVELSANRVAIVTFPSTVKEKT